MDAETIRQRLTDISNIFEKIRDHPRTPPEVQRIADFGQGRVANLQIVVASKISHEGVPNKS